MIQINGNINKLLHCTVKSKYKYLFVKGEEARKPKWNTAKKALSDLKNALLIK